MSDDDVKLLPCPFCGTRAEWAPNPFYGDNSMARCVSCGATVFGAKWNRRAILADRGRQKADFAQGILAAHTAIVTRAANADLHDYSEALDQLADDVLALSPAHAAQWKTGQQMYAEGLKEGSDRERRAHVDAIDTSSERVDETREVRHIPPSIDRLISAYGYANRHPEDADRIAAAYKALAEGLSDEAKKALDYARMLNKIMHDMIVANQSAWIEWRHGKGAEAAMTWVHNGLVGPGQIPDEDAPYGKEPQAWFDANRAEPFPTCFCGRPSNQLWMGEGFCSQEHYAKRRAEYDGALAGEQP